ncbi:hypothetical protein M0R19_05660 [Candidatus Pacearchaeota archaeon]|nr:hypothetical protein [Candidatus Pacearchaeota archaeon]
MKQRFSYYICKLQKILFGTYVWINSLGIAFEYDGDEVILLWSWLRKNNKKYYSTSFCASYKTLQDLDTEWVNYFKAVNN